MKLRITMDGTPAGTRITDAETGEDVGKKLGVRAVRIEAGSLETPRVWVELLGEVTAEVSLNSPHVLPNS